MFGGRFSAQKDLVEAFYLLQRRYNLQLSEPSKGDNGLKIYGHRSEDQKQFSITLAYESDKVIGWTVSAAGGRKLGTCITIQNKKKRPEKDVSSENPVVNDQPDTEDGIPPLQQMRYIPSIVLKPIDMVKKMGGNELEESKQEEPKRKKIFSFYEQFYVDGHNIHHAYLSLTDFLKKKILERKEWFNADQQLVIKNFGLEYTTINIDMPTELRLQIAWILDLADCLDGKT